MTQHNFWDIANIHKIAIKKGAQEWDVFLLVPTGRGKSAMVITPQQYEETLNQVYTISRSSPIPVKVTCAPQYTRIIAQHQSREIQPSPNKHKISGRGCMAGNGFCFISHTGDVFGCGFLPITAGSIRQQKLKDIYQKSSLFIQLRNHVLLKGKCGKCFYNQLCSGCRARAFSVKGDYLEEDTCCIFQA